MNDINSKIAHGAVWMVAFKLIDRSAGLVSTIILARLLSPADFGLVAMAMVLIAALQLMVSFSFDVLLIQNPQAARDEFDTAWTFNCLFACAAAMVLALLAHPASIFYSEPRLTPVIYWLALGFAVQGFSNIGPVIFRREMRFDREFKFLLAKRVATLAVTIPLAFLLRNYWTLVIGQLLGGCIMVALSYIVSDYRPRFSMKARRELFNSSKWLVINNILQFLNNRSAEFFIGRLTGAQSLGIYNIALEISILPTTELVAPINRAAFPGYSKVSSDPIQLRNSFLNVISMIALFACPAGIGIALVADLMVPVMLGWAWQNTVPVIQILAIFGVIQALQTNIGYVYLATGKLRLIAALGLFQFILLLSFLIPLLYYWGVVGAAWAFLVSATLMIPVNQIFIARYLELSSMEFFGHIARPLISAMVMGAFLFMLKSTILLPPQTAAYLIMLIVCILSGALVFSASLYMTWIISGKPEGPEKFVFKKIRSTASRFSIFNGQI
jgi:lipopolysaccharide exporter